MKIFNNVWYHIADISTNFIMSDRSGMLAYLFFSQMKVKILNKVPYHLANMSRNMSVSGRSGIWRGAFITRSIVPKSPQETPHSSPVRARYGVFFVNSKFHSCSAAAAVVFYVY